MDGSAPRPLGVSRFIGTSRAKGKPTPACRRGEPWPRQRTWGVESDLVCDCGRVLAAAASSAEGRLRAALQHVALPQRAALTFSLSVLRPTAPTTTSLPTT